MSTYSEQSIRLARDFLFFNDTGRNQLQHIALHFCRISENPGVEEHARHAAGWHWRSLAAIITVIELISQDEPLPAPTHSKNAPVPVEDEPSYLLHYALGNFGRALTNFADQARQDAQSEMASARPENAAKCEEAAQIAQELNEKLSAIITASPSLQYSRVQSCLAPEQIRLTSLN
ncbi:MAG: hypothetical protein J0L97_09580 [Alphaproteobacteria bacterium]|nr:hypothetical protein [Alphaproteobacteria bacterium]